MSTLTYLCPCCNNSDAKGLKSISEIGFSLRNPFYKMLIDAIEEKASPFGEISSAMEAVLKNLGKNQQFRYLGPDDIRALFPGKPEKTTSYWGDMVVKCSWVKAKARTAWANRNKKDPDYVNIPFPEDEFPGDDTILYQDSYRLFYHYVDGVYVPKEIMRMHEEASDTQKYSSSIRRCSCGRVLSRVTGTAKEIIIVMQGSSRAGKSTTMVSLNHILNQFNLAAKSPIYIEPIPKKPDEEEKLLTWISQQDSAYLQCKKVEKTRVGKEELIFSFKLVVNNRSYVLTLVDMAGEIFDSDQYLAPEWHNNYSYIYKHCDAIWTSVPYQTLDSSEFNSDFLMRHYKYYLNKPKQYDLDLTAWKEESSYPHDLPTHQDFVRDISEAVRSSRLFDMLDKYAPVHAARMMAALGETNAALANADLKTYQARLEAIAPHLPGTRPPHAVILTKTDSIAELFTAGDEAARQELEGQYVYPAQHQQYDSVMHYYDARQKDRHFYRFNTNDSVLTRDKDTGTVALSEETVNRVCRNVRKFFTNIDPIRVDSFNELCPGKTCDFALSAYGRSASSAQNSRPQPFNVALPLLWTLAVIGILPVSYVQTTVRPRTPEEAAADGIGLVVTEESVICKATDNPISMENLYANEETYTFHESNT